MRSSQKIKYLIVFIVMGMILLSEKQAVSSESALDRFKLSELGKIANFAYDSDKFETEQTTRNLKHIDHFVEDLDLTEDERSGFQALAVDLIDSNGKSARIIGFAGTQLDKPSDIMADAGIIGINIERIIENLLANNETDYYQLLNNVAPNLTTRLLEKENLEGQISRASIFFLENTTGKGMGDVIVVGHSLGGYVAQIIAAQNNAVAITFNAPGAASYDVSLDSDQIRNYTRQHDIVGNYGEHIGLSSVNNSQDPMNYIPDWQVGFEDVNNCGPEKSRFNRSITDEVKGKLSSLMAKEVILSNHSMVKLICSLENLRL